MTTALEYLEYRLNNLFSAAACRARPRGTSGPGGRWQTLDAIVFDIIARRRSEPERDTRRPARDAPGRPRRGDRRGLTDRELRDQILTFIGAGHETTAVALAWTFYLLSQHPEAEARLRDEVAAARRPHAHGRRPAAAGLHPPGDRGIAPALSAGLCHGPRRQGGRRDRRLSHPGAVDGHPQPRMSPTVTPASGPTPRRSTPTASRPSPPPRRPRFAWYPFLGGPHQCIGQEFAMMETTLVVAMLVQSFRLRLAPGFQRRAQADALAPAAGRPADDNSSGVTEST